jgi:PAS domain S-box-containing protein
LRESEEKYRHVVENVGVGILTIREDRLVFVNSKVEEVLGISKDELLRASDPFGFLHPEDRDQVVQRHYDRLQGRELSPSNEFRVITPDGRQLWVESTNVRIELQGRPTLLNFLTDITGRKRLESEREQLIERLQNALGEVKALSGLLPICSNCKKIRDDSGYWKQVEFYIQEHSQAQFSHSICPDCIKKLYPEVAKKVLKQEITEG